MVTTWNGLFTQNKHWISNQLSLIRAQIYLQHLARLPTNQFPIKVAPIRPQFRRKCHRQMSPTLRSCSAYTRGWWRCLAYARATTLPPIRHRYLTDGCRNHFRLESALNPRTTVPKFGPNREHRANLFVYIAIFVVVLKIKLLFLLLYNILTFRWVLGVGRARVVKRKRIVQIERVNWLWEIAREREVTPVQREHVVRSAASSNLLTARVWVRGAVLSKTYLKFVLKGPINNFV